LTPRRVSGTFSSQEEKIRLQLWKAGIVPNWPQVFFGKTHEVSKHLFSQEDLIFLKLSDLFGAHCFGHKHKSRVVACFRSFFVLLGTREEVRDVFLFCFSFPWEFGPSKWL
jgi:hypothetical protein